jgi:hypothetical protein
LGNRSLVGPHNMQPGFCLVESFSS